MTKPNLSHCEEDDSLFSYLFGRDFLPPLPFVFSLYITSYRNRLPHSGTDWASSIVVLNPFSQNLNKTILGLKFTNKGWKRGADYPPVIFLNTGFKYNIFQHHQKSNCPNAKKNVTTKKNNLTKFFCVYQYPGIIKETNNCPY